MLQCVTIVVVLEVMQVVILLLYMYLWPLTDLVSSHFQLTHTSCEQQMMMMNGGFKHSLQLTKIHDRPTGIRTLGLIGEGRGGEGLVAVESCRYSFGLIKVGFSAREENLI